MHGSHAMQNRRTALQGAAIVLVLALCSSAVFAEQVGIADGAPPQLAHWSGLIGQWSTQEEGLKADGSGWDASKGADWHFYWSLGGWGVRDDYYSPPLAVTLGDESSRQRGTNLRIYDAKSQQWVMTWLTTTSTHATTFTAQSTDQEIVMRADALNPQGFHSRITFFDIQKTSFEWKLEWSKDEESWFEVYRIHGTRKPQE